MVTTEASTAAPIQPPIARAYARNTSADRAPDSFVSSTSTLSMLLSSTTDSFRSSDSNDETTGPSNASYRLSVLPSPLSGPGRTETRPPSTRTMRWA